MSSGPYPSRYQSNPKGWGRSDPSAVCLPHESLAASEVIQVYHIAHSRELFAVE